LRVYDNDASSERFRIDASGNVGIGTSSPSSTLVVGGNATTTAKPTVAITDTTSGATLSMRGQSPKIAFDVTSGGVPKILMDNAGLEFKTGTLDAEGDVDFKIDSAGHVTMPNQPAFLAKPTSNITNLTINVDTTVTFGTEIFDQNSDFASNTFTAPVSGKYQLSLQIRFNQLDVDGTFYEVKIFTSNREYRNIIDMRPFDADVPNYTSIFTILADMDAGDTANVKVKPYNSGASQADIVAAHTYFSAFLAC
jgi:hypothetical protein